MATIRLSISQKVILSAALLLLFFIANVVVIFYTLNQSKDLVNSSSQVLTPSIEATREYILLVTRSRMYITNWVYSQHANQSDREALTELHHVELPTLKKRLSHLKVQWDNKKMVAELDSVIIRFDELVLVQERIMNEMKSFDDFNEPNKAFFAHSQIEDVIIPVSYRLIDRLDKISIAKMEHKIENDRLLHDSMERLNNIIIILAILICVVGVGASYTAYRTISQPIRYVSQNALQLAKGEIPDDYKRRFGSDEIGDMSRAMATLVESLKGTSNFAENIGKGNYTIEYQPLSEKDILGNSLLNMRDNLQRVADDTQKRRWTNEGLAKFADILRLHHDNTKNLAEEVVTQLAKYVRANQISYLAIDDKSLESKTPFMHTEACYAWDRKKNFERIVYKGEGLTGQAWIENDKLYLTDIPQDYLLIGSGLGETNPTCLLIMPVKTAEIMLGVLELAFLEPLQPYEILFVERIAENFAATLSVVKNSEKNKRLLEESKLINEQMASQEEEMRQTVEEILAQQESVSQMQQKAQEMENMFNRFALVMEVDKDFFIQEANNNADAFLGYAPKDLKLMSLSRFFDSPAEFADLRSQLIKENAASVFAYIRDRYNSRRLFKINATREHNSGKTKYLLVMENVTDVQKYVDQYKGTLYF